MKGWQKVLLLLTIIAVCCMVTSYFLFEGYTQEERDSDRQKILEVGTILRDLVTSGVLPSKIPLSRENKEKVIEGASALVRVAKNDALMYFNQNSERTEEMFKNIVKENLDRYTADVGTAAATSQ